MRHLFSFGSFIVTTISVLILSSVACSTAQKTADSNQADTTVFSEKEQLGKLLFFEESLSSPEGQSCATCHDPSAAFADPVTELPVSRGAVHSLYGNRNDMTASYAMYIPALHKDPEENIWVGGLFWDGRVNTLEEQAMEPPLNPVEMANPDVGTILEKLKALPYADQFLSVYGSDALSDADKAFGYMADAIAAYQRTDEVNPFTSKYDYWLKGEVDLTDQELRGLKIFELEDKGNCAACHPNTPAEDGTPPLVHRLYL